MRLVDLVDKRVLIVTAHSDDETLFAGGLIIRYGNPDWKIICATNEVKSPRGLELATVAKLLGVRLGMLGLMEGKDAPVNKDAFDSALTSELAGEKFDYVLTHNIIGEYGHPQHIACHELACLFFRDQPKFFFGAYMNHDSAMVLHLTRSEIERREQALGLHGSQEVVIRTFRGKGRQGSYGFRGFKISSMETFYS